MGCDLPRASGKSQAQASPAAEMMLTKRSRIGSASAFTVAASSSASCAVKTLSRIGAQHRVGATARFGAVTVVVAVVVAVEGAEDEAMGPVCQNGEEFDRGGDSIAVHNR